MWPLAVLIGQPFWGGGGEGLEGGEDLGIVIVLHADWPVFMAMDPCQASIGQQFPEAVLIGWRMDP